MARAVTLLGAKRLDGRRFSLEHERDGVFAVVRREDGQHVGELALSSEGDRELTIERLCIEEPFRSYGAGSEAAGLVLNAAKQAAYSVVRGFAPAELGLAVYFWARMGMHPRKGGGAAGGIWMERRLD